MLVLVGGASPRAREALANADVVAGDRPEADLLAALRAGATVAALTDRPRDRLVRAALAAGVPVTAVPGPSPLIAALAVSGLPSDRFCVEDARDPARLATEPRTLVFPDPGPLAELAAALGADRPAVLCRPDGTVLRAPLGALAGPGVLVVAGAPAVAMVRPDDAGLRAEVARHEAGGTPRRDAITLVAREHGLPRREVYQAVITR
jgi:16S rRNA (cytidine1402-2'-O)-methyltransferase